MNPFEDSRQGLPPPPAPTRRGANPWKLSAGAAKQPEPAPRAQDVLKQLLEQAGAPQPRGEEVVFEVPEEPEPQPHRPPEPGRRKRGIGVLPLIVFAFAALVVLRQLFEAREHRNWAALIGPVLILLFVLHGLWQMRRRRQDEPPQ